MSNDVCKKLGIKYPVIQGAMAWTSMAPLVAAVSEAGGLGVLGSGFMPKEIISEQIAIIRKMTSKPFAANVFLDEGPQLEIGASAIIENKVPVAYLDTLNLLDYDMAKEFYDRFHKAGILVVTKINCLHDALVAEKAGADVIIAKGIDGGGHCAKIGSMILLGEVIENIKSVPIVASGGIATPAQAAGCIVMGAQGIEMGSAFVATQECPVHENVKKAIVKAADIDVVPCGYSTGEASWQIKNKLADRLIEIEANYPKAEAAEKFIKASEGSLRIASLEGDVEEKGSVMSGAVAGLIKAIRPVEDYVAKFCGAVEEILSRKHSLNIE